MKKVLFISIAVILVGLGAVSASEAKSADSANNVSQSDWAAFSLDKNPVYEFDAPTGEIKEPDPGTILQGGDAIADAYVIPGLPFDDAGSTVGYTNDWDPPCSGSFGGPDVVYSYAPGADVKINVNTCGGTFYDVLYVYCDSADSVEACNDFYNVCPPHSGIDNLQLYAGHTYYFVVDGYYTSEGAYEIHIVEVVSIECPPEAILESEPDCGNGYIDNYNSGCNDPIAPLYLAINPGNLFCGTSGNFVRNDTTFRDTDWYRLVLTEPKLLHWYVTAEFPVQGFIFDADDENCDNIKAVYQGQAAPPDTIHIVHNALPGTYYFYVSPLFYTGYDCPMNYLAWLVTEDPPPAPANDNCESVTIRQLMPGDPVIAEGNTIGATTQCRDLELIPEVWEAFSFDVQADVKVEFCGTSPYFSSGYVVQTDACPCDGYIMASMYNSWECGDNNFTMNWYDLPAGTYYFPVMSKWGEAYGDYHLTFSSTSIYPGIAANTDEIIGEAETGNIATVEFTFSNIGYAQLDFSLEAAQTEPLPEWLAIDLETGSLPVGDSAVTVNVTMDGTSLPENTYTGSITITSNAPDKPELILPVTFNVGPAGYEYLPGDVNMSGGAWPPMATGPDVTYLVNFFRGLPTSHSCLLNGFWCSADANGDCNIIGSDVTKLVNVFRGLSALDYCIDYPPVWPPIPEEAPSGWPGCE